MRACGRFRGCGACPSSGSLCANTGDIRRFQLADHGLPHGSGIIKQALRHHVPSGLQSNQIRYCADQPAMTEKDIATEVAGIIADAAPLPLLDAPSAMAASAIGWTSLEGRPTIEEIRINRTLTPEQMAAKYRPRTRSRAGRSRLQSFEARASTRRRWRIRQAIVTSVKFENACFRHFEQSTAEYWQPASRPWHSPGRTFRAFSTTPTSRPRTTSPITTNSVERLRRQCYSRPQGSRPASRSTAAASGERRNFRNLLGLSHLSVASMPTGRENRRHLQFARDFAHDLDARNLLQLADLLHGKVGLVGQSRSAVRPDGMTTAWASTMWAIPSRAISSRKQEAAGADARIGDRAGLHKRGAQRGPRSRCPDAGGRP